MDRINITGANLAELVRKAYELSRPQGMGHIHFDPAPLTLEEASGLVVADAPEYPVRLDYVKGRAVKLTVRRETDGALTIPGEWYDHTPAQLKQLVDHVNAADAEGSTKAGEDACNGCGRQHDEIHIEGRGIEFPDSLLDLLPKGLRQALAGEPLDIKTATAEQVADLVAGEWHNIGDRVVLTPRGEKEFKHPKPGEVAIVTRTWGSMGTDPKNMSIGMIGPGGEFFELDVDSRLFRSAPAAE